MIKVDLITGFLGSGKTTFIKNYAKYLISQNERIAILENDYGAINVDMMLLQEELGDQCELEMVAGGCDYDCHRRRFKTKLISMGMRGFDRVIIEPSGIFDVDEFFDIIHEDPLTSWYEIENVIAIVDSLLEENLSKQSQYLLASQVIDAGIVVFSKSQLASPKQIQATQERIQQAIELFKGKRVLNAQDYLIKDWSFYELEDYQRILKAGYRTDSIIKLFVDRDNDYDSLFFMNNKITPSKLEEVIPLIFKDKQCGHVFRIKGFLPDKESWLEINATLEQVTMAPMTIGQEVIIVIGEALNEAKIASYLKD